MDIVDFSKFWDLSENPDQQTCGVLKISRNFPGEKRFESPATAFNLETGMVKVDIVRAIQLETGLQFGEAEQLVNELLEIMKQTLENGEDVLITGLGKFQLRQKSSRPGRDPKNKQDYTISARQVVTFRPSKVWRDEINGKV